MIKNSVSSPFIDKVSKFSMSTIWIFKFRFSKFRFIRFILEKKDCGIDLGNVSRFPYLCYKYDGGSFQFCELNILYLDRIALSNKS